MSRMLLLLALPLAGCGAAEVPPIIDPAEAPSSAESTAASVPPEAAPRAETSPADIARLFARAPWAAFDGEGIGGVRFLIWPDLSETELTVSFCYSTTPDTCFGYDDSLVTVEGRTLRFDVVAYGDAPERVELLLLPDDRTLEVRAFPSIPHGESAPRTFHAADVFEELAWSEERDMAHDEGEHGDEDLLYMRGVLDAVRRGVVAAGGDPFDLDGHRVTDLLGAGMDAITPELRLVCNALQPSTCTSLYDAVSEAVSAEFRLDRE